MKINGNKWTMAIAVTCLVTLLSAGFAEAADTLQRQPATRSIQPAQQATTPPRSMPSDTILAVVRSASPDRPVLTAGGAAVRVTLSGTDLNLLTSAQVLLGGRAVTTVTARLGSTAAAGRQLTLTALAGAAAGNYQVQLKAGTRTINLPATVLALSVRGPDGGVSRTPGVPSMAARIQPAAPAPSSPSGDGVPGKAPSSQMSAPNQADDTSDRSDGFPASGPSSDAGNIRGVVPQSSTRKGVASGSTTPSLSSQSGAPSRQPPSNLASRVRSMGSSELLTPRELKPAVNPVAVTPEDVIAQRQAGTMSTAQFNRALMTVFNTARFDANACGGRDRDRKIVTSIPNTLHEEAVGALGRLDYPLTDGEMEQTRWDDEVPFGTDIQYRRKHIRACVDNWRGRIWSGMIEGGEFKVVVSFLENNQFITTRAMEQSKPSISPIWEDRWSWNSDGAVRAIPDFWFTRSALEVILAPQMDGERISYGQVDARWTWVGGNQFNTSPGRFRLQANRQRIVNYKDEALEIIRSRIVNVFNNSAVKDRLAQSITEGVTANKYVNSVTALTGGDGALTYEYE